MPDKQTGSGDLILINNLLERAQEDSVKASAGRIGDSSEGS